MTGAIVEIRDRAVAVLAIDEKLAEVRAGIDAENLRHAQSMCRLLERETALKDAIIKLWAKPC